MPCYFYVLSKIPGFLVTPSAKLGLIHVRFQLALVSLCSVGGISTGSLGTMGGTPNQ